MSNKTEESVFEYRKNEMIDEWFLRFKDKKNQLRNDQLIDFLLEFSSELAKELVNLQERVTELEDLQNKSSEYTVNKN